MEDIHNHTLYSDGYDTPEEIIKNALKKGITTLGFSDHNRALQYRYKNYENLINYFNTLEGLKMSYRGKIKILTGIELNLNFEDEQEENNIPFDKFDKLDFCLFEHVDGTEPYKPITKYCIRLKDINQIRQRVKCEAGLAHTDLLELSEIYSNGKELEYGMDCVISMMKEYNLFWEINTDKEHHYFDYIVNNWRASNIQKLFMKLKDNGVKIRSGSDTHNLRFYRIDRVRISNSMSAFEYFPEL